MTVKQKFKPAARSDIRERVELRFRARGAVAFHLLLVLVGAVLLLYNFSYLWASRLFNGDYMSNMLAFVVLAASGAFHFIRYHYRHGKGRDKHEAETEALIARQLQRTAPEDASEQEVLVRLQQADKLKNRRLVWQHLTLFAAVISLMILIPLSDMTVAEILDWATWQDAAIFTSVWGIGLQAHVMRFVFAYRVSTRRREAKIEQQLARELRREKRQRLASARTSNLDSPAADDDRGSLGHADASAERRDETSIEDLLRGQPPQRASWQ